MMTRRTQLNFISLLLATAAFALLLAVPPAAAQSTDSARFRTPSGNINCAMYADETGDYGNCLVKDSSWKNPPKRPTDCDLDWEPAEAGVYSEKKGTSVVNSTSVGSCRGDIGPLCEPGGCITLAYGKSIQVGRIKCTSQKAGVTCIATEGRKRGFTVARSGYKLLS